MVTTLGTLRTRDPHTVWAHEAHDFTPWLASHIDLLGAALKLDLEVDATEVAVGDFNVDILARDLATGHPLIIENQLEPTDHSHLGQLLTYASGKDAAYVVWVSPKFRDEHRQAIDWLNAHTIQGVDFFGIEIELLQIEDSPPAAHFKLVAQPNAWAQDQRRPVPPTSERGLRYQQFFTDVLARYKKLRPHDTSTSHAGPQNWLAFSAGRAGFGFTWSMPMGKRCRVELYIDTGDTSKAYFDALRTQAGDIETALGHAVAWERLDERRACRLAAYRDVPDQPPFEDNDELKDWAVKEMARWAEVLRPRLRQLSIPVTPVAEDDV